MNNRPEEKPSFDADAYLDELDEKLYEDDSSAETSSDKIISIITPHLSKLAVDDITQLACIAARYNKIEILQFLDRDARCRLIFEKGGLPGRAHLDDCWEILDAAIDKGHRNIIAWLMLEKRILEHIPAARVVNRIIYNGQLELLKWVTDNTPCGEIINNKGKDADYVTYQPDDFLPPVLISVQTNELEILKWLVDEKGHSLNIQAVPSIKQNIVHMACIFRYTPEEERDKEGDWYCDVNTSGLLYSENHAIRLDILKWLVNDKKQPAYVRCPEPWSNRKERPTINIYQLLFSPHSGDSKMSFPIVNTLMENTKIFSAFLASFSNQDLKNFTCYIRQLSSDKLRIMLPRLMRITKEIYSKMKPHVQSALVRLYSWIALNERSCAQHLFANFGSYGITDEAIKNDIDYLSKFMASPIQLVEKNAVSDEALREIREKLIGELKRFGYLSPPENYLKICKAIRNKNEEDNTNICMATTRVIAAKLNLPTVFLPHHPPRPQFVANDMLSLAESLQKYLDKPNFLSEAVRMLCQLYVLDAKIFFYTSRHQYNRANEIYHERLLLSCRKQALFGINFSEKQLNEIRSSNVISISFAPDFLKWSQCYESSTIEHKLLKFIDQILWLNDKKNFYLLVDEITKEAEQWKNISLLFLLHDCIEYTLQINSAESKDKLELLEEKFLEVKTCVEKVRKLSVIAGNSAAPLMLLLGKIEAQEKQIASLTSEVNTLKAQSSNQNPLQLFSNQGNLKRAHSDNEEHGNEHADKKQRTLDAWVKR